MAVTVDVTKGLIGREDFSLQNNATQTFSRATSTGGTLTMTKANLAAPNTFCVDDFGATGDGTTDDAVAVIACYAAASAVDGTVVFSPGKTYVLAVQTADTPIITITGSVTTFAYGATIKVTCSVANALTTKLNEQDNGAVFKAIGQTDLNFFGGTFDGNRDDATQDPRYGFALVIASERVTVRDMVFKNCQSDNGPFKYRDYDLDSGVIGKTKFFTFESNRVDQCANGIRVSGAFEYTRILNNTFTNLDLGIYDSTIGPNIADPYGTVVTIRAINVNGFSSNLSFEQAGPCVGLEISGNHILGSSFGIELYNGNNTNGDDPSEYQDVVLTNNHMWTTSGFNTNYMNNIVLSGNTWRGMTDVDYADYAGRRYQGGGSDPTSSERSVSGTIAIAGTAGEFTCSIASDLSVSDLVSVSGTLGGTGTITGYSDYTNYRVSAVNVDSAATTFTLTDPDGVAIVTTAGTLTGLLFKIVKVSYGNFVEATPSYNMVISNNVMDGGWRANASNGAKAGIAIGWSSSTVPYRPIGCVISNNVIRNLYVGIQTSGVQGLLITGNHVSENRTNILSTADDTTNRISDASMTWEDNTLSGNTLVTAEDGDASNTQLQGDWVVTGNTFVGQDTMASGQTLLKLEGFDTTGGAANVAGTIAISGTGGQFTCSASDMSVGDLVKISGTLGGTGTITGYSNPTNYRVSAVDVDGAATAFTLTDTVGAAIVTTAGTLTGLTFAVTPTSNLGNFKIIGNTFKAFKFWAIGESTTAGQEVRDVWVDGNFFDSEDDTPGSQQCAYIVSRATTVDKTIRFGHNAIRRVTTPICIRDEASGGLTEDYNFGTWDHDSHAVRVIVDELGSTGYTNTPPAFGLGPHRRYQLLNLADGLTATGLLPASSEIHGVSVKVTGAASGSGVTSLKVGDGSTTDLWGKVVALSTNSDNSDISDGTNGWSATARYFTGDAGGDVVIGGNGGTPTAGVVAIVVHYTKMLKDLPGSAD